MTQTPSLRKKIQNLRSFTVQILHCKTNSIVGTGFVVSEEGLIATCAHVVLAAGINPRLGEQIPSFWKLICQSFLNSTDVLAEAETVEITVHFPQAKDLMQRTQKATVDCCFHDYDDDVVLLKLKSALLPEGVRVAIVETASDSVCYSTEHRFKSFGYRRLSNYQGLPADGSIIDFCDPPNDRTLKSNPLVLKSQHIDSGMSGAPVLDIERDRVIGIIAETSDIASGADRDTSFAVDYEVVLGLLGISKSLVNLSSNEEKEDETNSINSNKKIEITDNFLPQVKPTAIRIEDSSVSHIYLAHAPAILQEWVDREALLTRLNHDWLEPNSFITGLIGFGGEGKSSLARRWIDYLFQSDLNQPDGVFWWGFYEHRNVDEFFEQLLKYLVPELETNKFGSNNAKSMVINAALSNRKCILILDGLEILQHQKDDEFGLLTSCDLKTWLRSFAEGNHQSFCLITSRVPLLDLIDFTTYNHREVEHLSDVEGVELLQNLGLQGNEATLLRLVQQWNGYALVLNLIGSYGTNHCEGNLHCLNTELFYANDKEESKYDKVSRVLHRYDDHLKLEEQLFLNVFSAFRLPVPKEALKFIFSLITTSGDVQALGTTKIINALVEYRILRHNPQTEEYTAHPLVRDHYLQKLMRNVEWSQKVQQKIGIFYLSSTKKTPENLTINDLRFPIEAVHHYCQAGCYEEAYSILWERIYQRQRWVITRQLGAYEVSFALVSEFFPNGDITKQPLLKGSKNIIAILGVAGHLQKNLGNLQHALDLYSRCINSCLKSVEIFDAASNYINLANIHSSLGNLDHSLKIIHQVFKLATHIKNKKHRRLDNKKHRRLDRLNINLNAKLGWFSFLSGDLSTANRCFQMAERLERKVTRTTSHQRYFLYGINGIYHAKFLQKVNKDKEAFNITLKNLDICENNSWQSEASWCYCVLGDLFAVRGEVESAREYYDRAIVIARNINHRIGLITALSTRGTWFAYQGDSKAALNDLREALDYAVISNYRLCEIDIRVGLSWAYVSLGNQTEAKKEVEKARMLSEATGYFWGRKGVEKALTKIKDEQ